MTFALACAGGWWVARDNSGYQSLIAWFPDSAVCVVILSNDELAGTDDLLRQLKTAAP